MPSGSHMTSGGSHFHGGGASHSGSSSHSSSSTHVQSGPMFIWLGRRRVQVPARYSFLMAFIPFLFIVALCLLLVGGFSLQSNLSQLRKIEADRSYYLSMIEYAEENPEYVVTGTIYDVYYNEDCDRWFFMYEIPYTNSDGSLFGETFCVYSQYEIARFHISDAIQIAVNSPTITETTDSIPMDYKNIPLEKDGEFLQTMTSRNVSIGLICGGGAAFLLIVALASLLVVKVKAEERNKSTSPIVSGQENKKPSQSGKRQPHKTANFDDPFAKDYFKCPNCGADVTADQKCCSICGTKLKK